MPPSLLTKATSFKQQATSLTRSCIHDNVGFINQQKGHMKKNILKKEYQPGGSKRHKILEKAVRYLLDPRFGTQNFKHAFLTEKLGLSQTEYMEALNKASNGEMLEEAWN